MITLDAGVVLEVVATTDQGRRVAGKLRNEALVSPALMDAEVFHRIVMMEKHGLIDRPRAAACLEDLRLLPVRRVPVELLFRRGLEVPSAASGYDSFYVALALAMDASLMTTDERLARVAREQFGLMVILIPTSGRSAN